MGLVVLVAVLAGALELGPVDAGVPAPEVEAQPGSSPPLPSPPLPSPGSGEATLLAGAATAGVALSTSPGGSLFVPTLAARFDVAHATGLGTVRARLAALLPLKPSNVFSVDLFSVDLGSFVEFESRPLVGDVTLAVRLQPFSATRLVTFDWANATPPTSPELSPVLSLDLHAGDFSAFAARRAVGRQGVIDGLPMVTFDVLAGAALAWPAWRLEVRAGSFSWGQLPPPFDGSPPSAAWGLAATSRATWTLAGGVEPPLDLATYAREPGRFERLFAAPSAPGGETSATVSLEVGLEAQQLRNSATSDEPFVAPAGYADLQARVRVDHTRLHAGARLATVGHLFFGERAFAPLGAPTSTTPWVSGALGADQWFERAGLTPGVMLRVTQPGVLQNGPGGRPVLVESPDLFAFLADGAAVVPVLATKVSLRWDPVKALAVLAELEATWDWNGSGTGLGRPLSLTTRTQLFIQGRF